MRASRAQRRAFSIDGLLAVHKRARFRVRPGTVRLRLAKPVPAQEVVSASSAELHARVRVAAGLDGGAVSGGRDSAPKT